MVKDISKLEKWDSLDVNSHIEHKATESKSLGKKSTTNRRSAISLSMSPEEKDRYTKMSKDHGLSLSAFFRLAADEYAENHDW